MDEQRTHERPAGRMVGHGGKQGTTVPAPPGSSDSAVRHSGRARPLHTANDAGHPLFQSRLLPTVRGPDDTSDQLRAGGAGHRQREHAAATGRPGEPVVRRHRRSRRPGARPARRTRAPGGARGGHSPARALRPPGRRQVPQCHRRGPGRPGPDRLPRTGQGRRRLRPRPRSRLPRLRDADRLRRDQTPSARPERAVAAAAPGAGGPRPGGTRPPGAGAAVRRAGPDGRGDRARQRADPRGGHRGAAVGDGVSAALARRPGPGRAGRRALCGGHPGRPRSGPRHGRGPADAGERPALPAGPRAPHPVPPVLPRPDPAADRHGGGRLPDAGLPPPRALPVPPARPTHAAGPGIRRRRGLRGRFGARGRVGAWRRPGARRLPGACRHVGARHRSGFRRHAGARHPRIRHHPGRGGSGRPVPPAASSRGEGRRGCPRAVRGCRRRHCRRCHPSREGAACVP
ncbi:hypothetical protein QFZ63_000936 [Streptomyces sp. B3I7]|nr:hypothetical protein [Streptomyces sp. B3I7]